MNDEELNDFMQFMEDSGILEWVGMDDNGERTFVFNFEKMYEVLPELYYAILDELNTELLQLYKYGFVEIEYDESLNPKFRITDDGRQYLIDNGLPIPEDLDDGNS